MGSPRLERFEAMLGHFVRLEEDSLPQTISLDS